MKIKKVGVNTLAVLLISIGLIFLLNNFLSFDVWKIVSITWPLIIIIFGLEIIITKAIVSRKEEEMKMTISVGSVVMLIIILVTMGILSGVSSLNINLENGISIGDGIFNIYKYNSSFVKEYTQDINDNYEHLEVENSFGDIRVKAHDKNEINVKAEINIKNNDKEYAEEIADKLVSLEESNGGLKVATNREDFRENSIINNIEIDLEILVPKDINMKISDQFGNVDISDISSDIQIENKHGDVIVNNIIGNLEVENSYGDISITSVERKVKLLNKHGDISIYGNEELSDDVYIKNEFGDINLDISDEQEGRFSVNVKFGSIVTNLDLDIDEDTNFESTNGIIGKDSIIIDLINSHGDIIIN